MDGTRNRIYSFIFRGVGSGRLVYALGASPRICTLCSLPDCAWDRIIDAAHARDDVIVGEGSRIVAVDKSLSNI